MTEHAAHRRSTAVSLAILPVLLGALGACGSDGSGSEAAPEQTASAVCVDEQTQERVADSRCSGDPANGNPTGGGGGSPFLWFFLGQALGGRGGATVVYPAVGSRVGTGAGSYTRPAGSALTRVAPAGGRSSGGVFGAPRTSTVSRGGIGGTSKGGAVGG